MIVNSDGRFRSVRTDEEFIDIFSKEMEALSPDERIIAMELLGDYMGGTKSPIIEVISKDMYRVTPCSITEFLENPFYLGKFHETIYPAIKTDITEIFNGTYSQAILGGSLGGGKSTAGVIGLLRTAYEVGCMRDPHGSYGVSVSDTLSFVGLSPTEDAAERNIMSRVRSIIDDSQYFQKHLKPKMSSGHGVMFPNKTVIPPGASTQAQVLGGNVLSLFVDECVCGDTKILLHDGKEITAKDWFDLDAIQKVVAYDFKNNVSVVGDAEIKASSIQDVYEYTVDVDGVTVVVSGFSSDHPVMTPGGFVLSEDLNVGDEVVCYGQKKNILDAGAQSRLGSEVQEALFERDHVNPSAEELDSQQRVSRENEDRGNGEDALGGNEGKNKCNQQVKSRGTGYFGSERKDFNQNEESLDDRKDGCQYKHSERNKQSVIREDRFERDKSENERRCEEKNCICRNEKEAVLGETWEAVPYGRVQEESVGEKSNTQEGIQTLGRGEAENKRQQLLDESKWRLGLSWPCGDKKGDWKREESWYDKSWIQEYLRTQGDRNYRSRLQGSQLLVRAIWSFYWKWVSYGSRLFGYNGRWIKEGNRSEAVHLHTKSAREEKIQRCNKILPRNWNDFRGLGRDCSVGIIRQKKYMGKKPTYSVVVPGWETFVADGVITHNCNFYPKRIQHERGGEQKENVEVIYEAVKRRMESRFLSRGKLPGVIILASSKTTPDAFTETLIRKSTDRPDIYCSERAVWESQPSNRYSGKRFRVAAGNETKLSRILQEDEEEPEGQIVIPVPVEFYRAFEEDVEGAIRDFAGVATMSITPFLQSRNKIYECIDKTRSHPFNQEVWDHDVPGIVDWSKIAKMNSDGTWTPIHHPSAPRHIALDLSKNGDRTGFVVGCIAGYKPVKRFGNTSGQEEMAPVIHVDFSIAIQAPTNGDIIYSEIRRLIYEFSQHGFFIKLVTSDQFQSLALLQTLSQQGYKTKNVSVEPAGGPYEQLKQAFYEHRISMYSYPPLTKELRELQKNWKTGKVDHPQTGGKDIADGMAALISTLTASAYGISDAPVVSRSIQVSADDPNEWILNGVVASDYGETLDDGVPEWRHNIGEQSNSAPEWRQNAEKILEQDGQISAPDWKRNFQMPFSTG